MGSPVQIQRNDSFNVFLNRNTFRTYPVSIAPTSVLNTFPAGFTSTLTSPAWSFYSKGTAVESGHSAFYAFERLGNGFAFPNYLSDGSASFASTPVEIRARWFALTADPSKVSTNDAFVALTVFDPTTTVANYLTGGQFAQVRQSLTARTDWSLWVYDGVGGSYSYAFTVPESGSYPQGHSVKLTFDCTTDSVACVVDGAFGATASLPTGSFDGSHITGSALVGFTAFAGTTQTAATQTQLTVSSLSVLENTKGA